MPTENIQKLKILHLLRLLWTETDSSRGLTMKQIVTKLEQVGIYAERKSIYRDISALRDFGLNIVTYQRRPIEYAVVKESLNFNEVMMLIDAVQSSKFLSERKSVELVKSLKGLMSTRERELIDKFVHVEGRIKNQNESVFHNVDTLHEAIALNHKVQFLYCRYGTDFELHPALDPETGASKLYVETPVKVVFANGFYYLAAWSDSRKKMITFRIDRMKLLQVSDEESTKNEAISSYAYEDLVYQTFEMFDGEPVQVTLHIKAEGMGVIVDRFGRDVSVTNVTDEFCDVQVTVRTSPLFHGWLASMRDIIELVEPQIVVEEHEKWLSELKTYDYSQSPGLAK